MREMERASHVSGCTGEMRTDPSAGMLNAAPEPRVRAEEQPGCESQLLWLSQPCCRLELPAWQQLPGSRKETGQAPGKFRGFVRLPVPGSDRERTAAHWRGVLPAPGEGLGGGGTRTDSWLGLGVGEGGTPVPSPSGPSAAPSVCL